MAQREAIVIWDENETTRVEVEVTDIGLYHFEGTDGAGNDAIFIIDPGMVFEDGQYLLQARTINGSVVLLKPFAGWLPGELMSLGLQGKRQVVPEHEILALAVLRGDKAAAGALADWVAENWSKE